jgi:hypothetical protein
MSSGSMNDVTSNSTKRPRTYEEMIPIPKRIAVEFGDNYLYNKNESETLENNYNNMSNNNNNINNNINNNNNIFGNNIFYNNNNNN